MRVFEDIVPDLYHSCILTTYAFDQNLFNQHLRSLLVSKGITNIIILCDVSNELDAYQLKDLNYSIINVNTRGIFHPKTFTFIGKNNLLAHVGSGNLTYGGMGLNHEMFMTFACDSKDSPHYPVITEIINYQYSFTSNYRGAIETRLNWIIEHSNLVDGYNKVLTTMVSTSADGVNYHLLYNGTTSIYSNLIQLIPSSEINKIDILSLSLIHI